MALISLRVRAGTGVGTPTGVSALRARVRSPRVATISSVQALRILFGATFTVISALAIGTRLLQSADIGARFVTGAAVLSMGIFALCCAGLAYPMAFLAVGAVPIVLWFRPALRPIGWRKRPPIACLFAVIALLYFVAYFFNAMAPEISFDGTTYHLSLVARYLREHGFHPITWNLYAGLSEGAEMLYLFAFAFGQHSAASMVHFAFLLALTWQVFAYARRAGFPMAGAAAALLVFASPMMGVDGTSAYVDVALAAVVFTLFHLLRVWEDAPSTRLLIAIGLLAGFAYGVKYTGFAAVPFALAWVGWKSRNWKSVATVAAVAAAMVLPWMVKDTLWMHNPLAPFFNHWFPNPYVTAAFERQYGSYYRHYDLASLWQLPMQVTTYGHIGGLLGPLFLLAPVALLALRRPEGRRLLLAAVVFGANYFSNVGTRFLIQILPFVALAMTLALAGFPRLTAALVLVHALISWPTRIALYAAPDAWHLVRVPWRQALRIKSADEYLDRNMFFYDVARMTDRSTEPDATVFAYRPIPEAYTSRRILVNYESEPNQIVGAMIQSASFPQDAPAWRITFRFAPHVLTALRLTTRNTGSVMWRIHELDVPGHVQASTYPWTEQSASDGNAVTFWRSSELLSPGQWVEIDPDRPGSLGSLTIETTLEQREVQLNLEGRDASGAWQFLSDTPDAREDAGRPDLRPAVIEQLKERGIGYLLSFENEAETRDLREHADLWGIREVAHNKDARLYKIP